MNIPIFLASDNNYAPYLCTTMYSVLKHTESRVNFYILDGGITNECKDKIKKSLRDFSNFSIEYFDMTTFGLDRFPNLKHYSLNAFSRYFIPEIKPDLIKALYLDVDIIVQGDIKKLYEQELENCPIGAILEDFYTGNYSYLKEKIYPKYSGGSNYFNSGVLVLDLKKFRADNLTQKLVDMTIELKDTLSCPDQDVLNIAFENNFKIIDYKFNFMPDMYNYLEALHPSRAKEIRKNAIILHYTTQKPWATKSNCSKEFWQIAKKTDFYFELISKYKSSYINRLKRLIRYLFMIELN